MIARILCPMAIVILMVACKSSRIALQPLSHIELKDLLVDSLLNARALAVTADKVILASAAGDIWQMDGGTEVFRRRYTLGSDSVQPNFRAVAVVGDDIISVSIASPALVYKNDKLVYKEDHERAFYDAVCFWNEKEGIAIGDPTDGCMSMILTSDGGASWHKLSCDQLPMCEEGEAAFAASNSNICIVGDETWVATGGVASRILYSADKGATWTVYETPIVQGLGTTGIYAIDFYNTSVGYAIGGDYTKPADNEANKIFTNDGGKTWQLAAAGLEPGYRSCVQYIPGGVGRELLTVGFKGIDYSQDGGHTWRHLSDEGYYTVRFADANTAYLAGKGRVTKMTLVRE